MFIVSNLFFYIVGYSKSLVRWESESSHRKDKVSKNIIIIQKGYYLSIYDSS